MAGPARPERAAGGGGGGGAAGSGRFAALASGISGGGSDEDEGGLRIIDDGAQPIAANAEARQGKAKAVLEAGLCAPLCA